MSDGMMLIQMRFPSEEACACAARYLEYAAVPIHSRPAVDRITLLTESRKAPLLSNLFKTAIGEPSFNRIEFDTSEYVDEQ